MVICSICCKRKNKAYQLCTVCTPDSSKKICLHCYSNLCFMCHTKQDCIALHLKCPYCQTPMMQKDLKSSPLMYSSHYLEKANELYLEQLGNVVNDRRELLDIIKCQDRLIDFFTNFLKNRSAYVSQNLPHFNAISSHVRSLLAERDVR